MTQRSCSVEFSGSSGSLVDIGIRLALDPLRVARILLAIDALFIAVGAVVSFVSKYLGHERLMGFSDLLDVGSEGNLPNLYSSFLLMAAAMLLFVTAGSHWEKQQRKWRVLAWIFVYISVDEGAGIHDRLVEPLRKIFHLVDGLFFMSWVIIGIPIVIGLAIYFFPFVMSLRPRVRFWTIVSGAVYVSGALILEMVEGKYFAAHGDNGVFRIMISAEEGMEMLGVTAFIYAILLHLQGHRLKPSCRTDAIV